MTIEQQPSAVTLGQTLTVTINDLAFGGEGVARVNDFVLFIPYVIPGETAEVEVVEVKKTFGRAKLLRVVTPSADRATPACQHFGACGGCQYQHIAYPAQLAMKRKQIADIFQRIGNIAEDIVAPVVPCPQPYGYRNRIMIRSQWNKPEQRLNIGFVRADCGLVEDIFECKIAEPALNQQITHVRNNPPPKGGIKVVLRIPPEDWEVPRDSFFQNNFFLLPGLVETVRSALAAAGTKHLVDLYCGVGFFGIAVASAVESFVGVECDRMAITAARKNAAMKNATNGEFISANVEDALPNLVNKFSAAATSVLIDPPRKGCLPQTLQLLRDQRPAQIIYVSCHPATMARDLNILANWQHPKLMRLIHKNLQTGSATCGQCWRNFTLPTRKIQ
jgi:tRNA/tmRNA/rRNA uracil-C5-methylase (TrmA/RlmC/RlmD family)